MISIGYFLFWVTQTLFSQFSLLYSIHVNLFFFCVFLIGETCHSVLISVMPGKSVESGNLIPGKFCHWREILLNKIKKYIKKWWEILSYWREILDHIPGKCSNFSRALWSLYNKALKEIDSCDMQWLVYLSVLYVHVQAVFKGTVILTAFLYNMNQKIGPIQK